MIKKWWNKVTDSRIGDVIKHKHRFVVMDTDTYKEKFSFQLSGVNLFVTVGITVIVLIILTTVLIAFTPLREWIPGYTNDNMVAQTYRNAKKIDSLEHQIENQEWMIATMQAVLRGENPGQEADATQGDCVATLQQATVVYRRSREDSLLRAEVEREDSRYEVRVEATQSAPSASASLADKSPAITQLLFTPLKGKIVTPYDTKHCGVDISAAAGQPVCAAYSGTVVFAGYTAETGHVLALQHPGGVVTVYQSNS